MTRPPGEGRPCLVGTLDVRSADRDSRPALDVTEHAVIFGARLTIEPLGAAVTQLGQGVHHAGPDGVGEDIEHDVHDVSIPLGGEARAGSWETVAHGGVAPHELTAADQPRHLLEGEVKVGAGVRMSPVDLAGGVDVATGVAPAEVDVDDWAAERVGRIVDETSVGAALLLLALFDLSVEPGSSSQSGFGESFAEQAVAAGKWEAVDEHREGVSGAC